MLKLAKILLIILLLTLFLPIIPVQAEQTAVMVLESPKTDYYLGDNIYIDIKVKTSGQAVNVVRALMEFSGTEEILINDFELGDSLPYSSPDKELNNETNFINVAGFILAESIASDFILGRLIFKANKVGSSQISFLEGSHIISPEQEELINLSSCQGITINVLEKEIEPTKPPEDVNNAPVFEKINNQTVTFGEAINFQVNVNDFEGDNINLSWDIPESATFTNVIMDSAKASGEFTWQPTRTGVYTAVFQATDDNEDSKTSVMSIAINVLAVVNHAPQFEPVEEQIAYTGEILNFNVTATDPDMDNVILSMLDFEQADFNIITQGPTSTGSFSWIPQTSGIYNIIFKAVDDVSANPLSENLNVRVLVFGDDCPPCDIQTGGCPICECEEKEFEQIPESEKDNLIMIESITHPNFDIWYSNNNPKFTWQIKGTKPVKGVAISLDKYPYSDPEDSYYLITENTFSYKNVPDGIWYFHLKPEYDDGWGQTKHYPIKIDITSPEFFYPSIEERPVDENSVEYLLYFAALDRRSGIKAYQFKIDQNNWQPAESPLILNNFQGNNIYLRVIDKAGNAVQNTIDLKNYYVKKDEIEDYKVDQQSDEIITKESEINKLAAPIIDNVIIADEQGTIIIKKVITVIGHAEPASQIKLKLKGLQINKQFQTITNQYGYWLITIENDLPEGKYEFSAIAKKNGQISDISEKVYFSLSDQFEAETRLSAWFWIMIILLILGGMIIFVIQEINQKIFKD